MERIPAKPYNNRTSKRITLTQAGRRLEVVVGFCTSYGQPSADVSVTEHASPKARENGELKFDKWWEYGFRWRVRAQGESIEAVIAMFETSAAALRELRDEHNAKGRIALREQ